MDANRDGRVTARVRSEWRIGDLDMTIKQEFVVKTRYYVRLAAERTRENPLGAIRGAATAIR